MAIKKSNSGGPVKISDSLAPGSGVKRSTTGLSSATDSLSARMKANLLANGSMGSPSPVPINTPRPPANVNMNTAPMKRIFDPSTWGASAAPASIAARPYPVGGESSQDVSSPWNFSKTLADYLDIAKQLSGSGVSNQLSNLESQKAYIQNAANIGDSKLAAIYAALQDSIGKQASDTSGAYKDALDRSKTYTDAQQAAVQAANASAAAMQQKYADANGTGADAPRAADNTQAGYSQQVASGIGTTGNSAYQQLNTNGATQGNYLGSLKSSAGFAGASQRSALQKALIDSLSEISSQEASLKDSQGSAASSLAQTLYNQDYNQFKDRLNWQTDAANSAFDQAYKTAKLNKSSSTDPSNLKGSDKATYLLQQNNVPSAIQRQIFSNINASAGVAGRASTSINKSTAYAEAYKNIQANPNIPDEYKQLAYVAAASMLGYK